MRIPTNRFMRVVAFCRMRMGGGDKAADCTQKGTTTARRSFTCRHSSCHEAALGLELEIQLTCTSLRVVTRQNLPCRWTRVTAPRPRHQQ